MSKLKKVISDKKVNFTLTVFFILILDQFIKNFAQSNFSVVCNKGVAFGIGSNVTLLVLVGAILVFWILTWEKRFLSFVGLALIFAGGISNLFDRINFGCVRDFIAIYNFPVFNFADSVIFIGGLLIITDLYRVKK